MIKILNKFSGRISGKIEISGSKSESNRLLILQSIYPNLQLNNLSNSDDTRYLAKALASTSPVIDISHAGTAMRFLTAYFSVKEGREVVLTGSERMQNRPIGILVDALRSLGADIAYESKQGYPPLRIRGKRIVRDQVQVAGNVSSQYISALLLIAPSLENGLELQLTGKVTSVPYIRMTLAMLQDLGVETAWKGNTIHVRPRKHLSDTTVTVESDWSSASYFYSLVALSEGGSVTLSSYRHNSLQGDSSLQEIYRHFGVETSFEGNAIQLVKRPVEPRPLQLDLSDSPDLAQTIAVTCFGLGIPCLLTGLHTLKIKETDRLLALKQELEKLGADIEVTDNSLQLGRASRINPDVTIATYDDHRMAMAFAPLVLKTGLRIADAEVVTKSYRDFWVDFESLLD